MDMKKYSGEHFIKVADVRDGPIEGRIAVVREGQYDKPDLIFESGDVLSLNATNNKTLVRAYGTESDYWIGKQIEMFLGTIQIFSRRWPGFSRRLHSTRGTTCAPATGRPLQQFVCRLVH